MSSAWRALFPKLPRSMAISKVLTTHTTWPAAFPLPPESFQRADEQPDSVFYGEPRVNVHHIDDAARAAAQRHYLTLIEPYHGGAFISSFSSQRCIHLFFQLLFMLFGDTQRRTCWTSCPPGRRTCRTTSR